MGKTLLFAILTKNASFRSYGTFAYLLRANIRNINMCRYIASASARVRELSGRVRADAYNFAVLTEVCHNVAVEPHLQPLTGETLHGASSITQDGARLDVAADGFWGSRFERAFFDVKVFNPYVRSNQRSTLAATNRSHENSKKRAYDQRIREVEHGTFAPLVFSCTGGMGRAATATYRRLAALISTKRNEPYSTTMGWIQCRLSFSLLRASIMCLRGAWSSVGHLSRQLEAPINLISSEGRVPQLE